MVSNAEFIDAVFHSLPPETTPVVVTFRDIEHANWSVKAADDPTVARKVFGDLAPNQDNYFCLSSVKRAEHIARTADQLAAMHVVVLDDVGFGAGSKIKFDAIPLSPSYRIETSRGNYQLGYILDTPSLDAVRNTLLLKQITKTHGDRGGTMAAKVVRLPVGHNSKASRVHEGAPWQVRCASWQPEKHFALDELCEAFKVTSGDVQQEHDATAKFKSLRQKPEDDEVYLWLQDNGLLAEPGINAQGYVDIVCPWYEGHTDGKLYAGYSPLGAGTGSFAAARQFKCLHDHCADRTLPQFLQWVAAANGPNLLEQTASTFVERYVFVEAGNWVYDTATGLYLSWNHFRTAMLNQYTMEVNDKGKMTRVQLAERWVHSTKRKTVAQIGFKPSPEIIFEENGATQVNTYRPLVVHAPTDEANKAQVFIEHIQLLFGDEAAHAFGFFATTVHRPEVRIQHALLHVSICQGTGRGAIKQLLGKLMGERYVKTAPTMKQIFSSDFNEYIFQSLLVICDEVYDSSEHRFAVREQLRELITEKRMQVNVKYGFKGDAAIYANVMLLSNHGDALGITTEDRRIWAVVHRENPQPTAYFQRLYDAIADPSAVTQFYWWLHRYLQANEFDFGARAPENRAKAEMRNETMDDLERAITSIVEVARAKGVRAMYRLQFLKLLEKHEQFIDPHSTTSRRIAHILIERNVRQMKERANIGKRVRTRYPSATGKQYVLVIDRLLMYPDMVSMHAEAERVAMLDLLTESEPTRSANLVTLIGRRKPRMPDQ